MSLRRDVAACRGNPPVTVPGWKSNAGSLPARASVSGFGRTGRAFASCAPACASLHAWHGRGRRRARCRQCPPARRRGIGLCRWAVGIRALQRGRCMLRTKYSRGVSNRSLSEVLVVRGNRAQVNRAGPSLRVVCVDSMTTKRQNPPKGAGNKKLSQIVSCARPQSASASPRALRRRSS